MNIILTIPTLLLYAGEHFSSPQAQTVFSELCQCGAFSSQNKAKSANSIISLGITVPSSTSNTDYKSYQPAEEFSRERKQHCNEHMFQTFESSFDDLHRQSESFNEDPDDTQRCRDYCEYNSTEMLSPLIDTYFPENNLESSDTGKGVPAEINFHSTTQKPDLLQGCYKTVPSLVQTRCYELIFPGSSAENKHDLTTSLQDDYDTTKADLFQTGNDELILPDSSLESKQDVNKLLQDCDKTLSYLVQASCNELILSDSPMEMKQEDTTLQRDSNKTVADVFQTSYGELILPHSSLENNQDLNKLLQNCDKTDLLKTSRNDFIQQDFAVLNKHTVSSPDTGYFDDDDDDDGEIDLPLTHETGYFDNVGKDIFGKWVDMSRKVMDPLENEDSWGSDRTNGVILEECRDFSESSLDASGGCVCIDSDSDNVRCDKCGFLSNSLLADSLIYSPEGCDPWSSVDASQDVHPGSGVDATEGYNPSSIVDATCYNPSSVVDATEGYNPSSVVDATEGYNPSSIVDAVEGYNPSSVIHATEGYNPSSVIHASEGYNPSSVTNVTEGYNPSSVIDATEGYDPSSVVDATERYNPSSIVDATEGYNSSSVLDATEGYNLSSVVEALEDGPGCLFDILDGCDPSPLVDAPEGYGSDCLTDVLDGFNPGSLFDVPEITDSDCLFEGYDGCFLFDSSGGCCVDFVSDAPKGSSLGCLFDIPEECDPVSLIHGEGCDPVSLIHRGEASDPVSLIPTEEVCDPVSLFDALDSYDIGILFDVPEGLDLKNIETTKLSQVASEKNTTCFEDLSFDQISTEVSPKHANEKTLEIQDFAGDTVGSEYQITDREYGETEIQDFVGDAVGSEYHITDRAGGETDIPNIIGDTGGSECDITDRADDETEILDFVGDAVGSEYHITDRAGGETDIPNIIGDTGGSECDITDRADDETEILDFAGDTVESEYLITGRADDETEIQNVVGNTVDDVSRYLIKGREDHETEIQDFAGDAVDDVSRYLIKFREDHETLIQDFAGDAVESEYLITDRADGEAEIQDFVGHAVDDVSKYLIKDREDRETVFQDFAGNTGIDVTGHLTTNRANSETRFHITVDEKRDAAGEFIDESTGSYPINVDLHNVTLVYSRNDNALESSVDTSENNSLLNSTAYENLIHENVIHDNAVHEKEKESVFKRYFSFAKDFLGGSGKQSKTISDNEQHTVDECQSVSGPMIDESSEQGSVDPASRIHVMAEGRRGVSCGFADIFHGRVAESVDSETKFQMSVEVIRYGTDFMGASSNDVIEGFNHETEFQISVKGNQDVTDAMNASSYDVVTNSDPELQISIEGIRYVANSMDTSRDGVIESSDLETEFQIVVEENEDMTGFIDAATDDLLVIESSDPEFQITVERNPNVTNPIDLSDTVIESSDPKSQISEEVNRYVTASMDVVRDDVTESSDPESQISVEVTRDVNASMDVVRDDVTESSDPESQISVEVTRDVNASMKVVRDDVKESSDPESQISVEVTRDVNASMKVVRDDVTESSDPESQISVEVTRDVNASMKIVRDDVKESSDPESQISVEVNRDVTASMKVVRDDVKESSDPETDSQISVKGNSNSTDSIDASRDGEMASSDPEFQITVERIRDVTGSMDLERCNQDKYEADYKDCANHLKNAFKDNEIGDENGRTILSDLTLEAGSFNLVEYFNVAASDCEMNNYTSAAESSVQVMLKKNCPVDSQTCGSLSVDTKNRKEAIVHRGECSADRSSVDNQVNTLLACASVSADAKITNDVANYDDSLADASQDYSSSIDSGHTSQLVYTKCVDFMDGVVQASKYIADTGHDSTMISPDKCGSSLEVLEDFNFEGVSFGREANATVQLHDLEKCEAEINIVEELPINESETKSLEYGHMLEMDYQKQQDVLETCVVDGSGVCIHISTPWDCQEVATCDKDSIIELPNMYSEDTDLHWNVPPCVSWEQEATSDQVCDTVLGDSKTRCHNECKNIHFSIEEVGSQFTNSSQASSASSNMAFSDLQAMKRGHSDSAVNSINHNVINSFHQADGDGYTWDGTGKNWEDIVDPNHLSTTDVHRVSLRDFGITGDSKTAIFHSRGNNEDDSDTDSGTSV